MTDFKSFLTGISSLLILRVFAYMPWAFIDFTARIIGSFAYIIVKRKRYIAERNIQLCFPSMTENQVQTMAKENFYSTVVSIFELAKTTWGTKRQLSHWIEQDQLNVLFDLNKDDDNPIIIATPHFTTAYVLGAHLGSKLPCATIYHPPKNKWIHLYWKIALDTNAEAPRWFKFLFGTKVERSVKLIPHRGNMGTAVRALKKGKSLIFLPDQDLGMDKHVLFPPFFGVPAATVSSSHDLVRLCKAHMITCVLMRNKNNKRRFTLRVNPPIAGLGEDAYQDLVKLNTAFEKMILESPKDYFWLHRRFKTRPENNPTPLY